MAKKAYSRPQHKVSPLTVVIVAGIIFIFAALIAVSLPSDRDKIYRAYEASPNLQEDHLFKTISASNLMKVIDTDQPVMVYFGTPTCQVCLEEIGYYDIEFKNQNVNDYIDNIYYLEARLTDAQIAKLQSDYGFTLTGTPELYFIDNGSIVEKRADFVNDALPQAAEIRDFMEAVFTYLD